MSKFLATAAVVVGVVALAATGVGAVASAATLASITATVGVSVSTIATVASLAAATLSVAATALAPKPSQTVSPTVWKADPNAGIPYAMGRTFVAGMIVDRDAYGSDNKFQTINTVYSLGPIASFDTYLVDKIATGISADGTVAIENRGKLFCYKQLGATPEGVALGLGAPNITAASKLSGLAASSMKLVYDVKGGHTFTTEPQTGFVGHWVKIYDPRKDSTYPGGSGPQRVSDENTWTWSENPWLHALTWLIGRRHNGKLTMGVGMALAGIIMSQYVEAANVADANNWKIGGVVTSIDDKWDALKQMAQAGGGAPLRLAAQVGCIVNAPKISLATITVGDVVGDASIQTTQSIRDRINAIVPRCRFESQGWEIDAASPVVVDQYVAFDGKQRRKEVDYSLVQCFAGQDPIQAVQLARYDIENAREFGPITLPLKIRWMGYRPGDVVTAVLPELGLAGQDIMILNRSLSPQQGIVTMTARSETAGKHAFALGQTGTPPPTPSVTGPALVTTPGAAAWVLTGGQIEANGTTKPVLQITGSCDSDAVDAVLFEYRESATGNAQAGPWATASLTAPATERITITGVKDGTAYDAAISYRRNGNAGARLILGPAVAGQTSVPWQAGVTGPGKPDDYADVTVDALPGAFTAAFGRPGQDVVDDITAVTPTLAAEVLRAATWRGETDTVIYTADGTPVRTVVQQLGVTVDGHQVFIASLQQVDGNGNAKAITTINSDGVVTGTVNLVTGGRTSYNILADEFGVVSIIGGVAVKPFVVIDGVAYFDHIKVRQIDIGAVTTPAIAPNAVTGLQSLSFPDVAVSNAEVTLAEVTNLAIGDGKDGRALAQISFSQDGTGAVDTAMRVRAYVNTGSGYQLVRNKLSGIRVSSGDAHWSLPVAFPIPILASGVASIKITAQSSQIGGGGGGDSYARDIELDIFMGAR